jgi:raffinose/stachyose/melibiose transport system substrate-binding protein
MNEYAKAGLLKDITADVSGDWKASFAPGALAVYSANGVQYGVPHDMGMVGFWYNKDLFAKAKIANPPTTWKEFLADVKALKASGTTPISLGEADNWQGAFWYEYLATRIGGKDAFQAAYSRKGKFTDQPFIDAGKDLADLVALQPFQNGFLGLKQGDQAKAVGNGDAAMELMGQWAPSTENDNSKDKKGLGDKLGFFAFPMVEGGKGNAADALGGGNGWTVGKNAPKETTDFLKFLTSKDEQIGEAKLNMGIPVVKGGETGLSDPNMIAVQKGFASAPYFQLYWDQATTPALGDVINQSVAGLFAGTSKPEDVAKAIEASAAMELAK